MSAPKVIAIASGKGGTGKTLVAANVGIYLSLTGKKVVLVDGALGSPNLHVFAGVPRPGRTLAEALVPPGPGVPRLSDISVPTPVAGVRLISGSQDPASVVEPSAATCIELMVQLRELRADWIVLDLGSGTAPHTIDLFLAADLGVLVTVPEPASVELYHRFLRVAFARRLAQLGLADLVTAAGAAPQACEGGIPSALDIYQHARATHDPRLDLVRRAIAEFVPYLAVNSVRSKADMELGRALAAASHRRLGLPIGYLGHLEYDEAVWASTRRRRPLLIEHPETRIAKCFERIARGILAARPGAPTPGQDIEPSDSHYDWLDVSPTASFEDIRRANRRVRDIYGVESIAIAGLYDPATLEGVHRRLDVAYTTLMDAAKRKDYDREQFPEGVPLPIVYASSDAHPRPPVAARPPSPARVPRPTGAPALEVSRPPMPVLGPGTEYSGALLKQIREAHGVELRELSDRSKIGMAHLQAVEEERFAKLPAAVYVRGFLGEYARVLGLDPERVRETYLARVGAARLPVDDDRRR